MRDPARPTVPEVVPLVKALYRRHPAGCCLHIVLDDGNIDDDDVTSCRVDAVERHHDDCRALVEVLMKMTKTQRQKLYLSALRG